LVATVPSAQGEALDRIAVTAKKKKKSCYRIEKTFYLQLYHTGIGRQ